MSEHDDDDGLSWLSAAERAALDEDLDADDPVAASAGDAGDDADGVTAGRESQDLPGSHQATDASGGSDAEGEALPPFRPVYRVSLPEDYQQRVEALATASQALAKQYEDGDFDLAEFQARQRHLNEQEWSLRAAALKADLAREQQQQTLAQRWIWEQEAYFRRPEHRVFRDDPVIAHAFEGALKLLAADQNNETRDMPWFLEEAGRMTRDKVRELAQGMALAGSATGSAGANGSGRGAGRGSVGRPAVPASPPPSLARVPAAAMPDPGGDEFAYLDKLSGLEAERAMARLSPEQLDRYLAQ